MDQHAKVAGEMQLVVQRRLQRQDAGVVVGGAEEIAVLRQGRMVGVEIRGEQRARPPGEFLPPVEEQRRRVQREGLAGRCSRSLDDEPLRQAVRDGAQRRAIGHPGSSRQRRTGRHLAVQVVAHQTGKQTHLPAAGADFERRLGLVLELFDEVEELHHLRVRNPDTRWQMSRLIGTFRRAAARAARWPRRRPGPPLAVETD